VSVCLTDDAELILLGTGRTHIGELTPSGQASPPFLKSTFFTLWFHLKAFLLALNFRGADSDLYLSSEMIRIPFIRLEWILNRLLKKNFEFYVSIQGMVSDVIFQAHVYMDIPAIRFF